MPLELASVVFVKFPSIRRVLDSEHVKCCDQLWTCLQFLKFTTNCRLFQTKFNFEGL